MVGEGCGLEIALWRGPAQYPAGVCIRVHSMCASECLCVFVWVTVYMCECVWVHCVFVNVYVCVLLNVCESVCVCVSVSMCVEWRIFLSRSQKPKDMLQGIEDLITQS